MKARWIAGTFLVLTLIPGCASSAPEDATDANGAGERDPGATTEVTEQASSTAAVSTVSLGVPTLPDDVTGDTPGNSATDRAAGDAGGHGANPDELPLPATAAGLVAAIDETELALRQPGQAQNTAAPWGRRQQALYRVLVLNPDWADEVLANVDDSIREAVSLNWTASRELVDLVHSHTISDTLPAWRIEPASPADELLGYYREAEEATGVPWSILASINLIETRMGRIQGISTAGAVGPMQFLPTTWAECCDGDPSNPRDAINGAGRYLVQRGGDRDLDRAIFGYNNSDHYVAAVRSFAAVLDAEPELYYGYHAWQVYFLTTEGIFVLQEGYEEADQVLAVDWRRNHPDTFFPGS